MPVRRKTWKGRHGLGLERRQPRITRGQLVGSADGPITVRVEVLLRERVYSCMATAGHQTGLRLECLRSSAEEVLDVAADVLQVQQEGIVTEHALLFAQLYV